MYFKMARAITQFKILVADKNISVGLKQLNEYLKDLQVKEHAEIISVDKKNNMYHILYHITPITNRAL